MPREELQMTHLPTSTESSSQLQAYVCWVNGQLRRVPGAAPIRELRADMRDGTALANLLLALLGVHVHVHETPSTADEARDNVEAVLGFIASRGVRLHQTSAQDIIDGNLKPIMRVVLALAAHFKPINHRRRYSGSGVDEASSPTAMANRAPRSAVSMAQSPAAICEARVPPCPPQSEDSAPPGLPETPSSPSAVTFRSVRDRVRHYEGQRGHGVTGDTPASPRSQCDATSIKPIAVALADHVTDTSGQSEQGRTTLKERLRIYSEDGGGFLEAVGWEADVRGVQNLLNSLQAVLLNGILSEEEEEELQLQLSEDNAWEKTIILQGRLHQATEECHLLKQDVLKWKQESVHTKGVVDGLRSCLTQQEATLLQAKQELLRANIERESAVHHNAELQKKLEEKSALISELRREATLRRREGEEGRSQRRSCSNGAARPSGLTSPGHNPGHTSASHSYVHANHSLIRESLGSLRRGLSSHDPRQHTLDTLEQSILVLLESSGRASHARDARAGTKPTSAGPRAPLAVAAPPHAASASASNSPAS
ncbi:dixin isoform X2 [Lethenteron reissneri]|uniref:dixin isoform X2 n=1 Tax=Lethenteron reissneri TaxID=7753 RepID=UPI002AB6C6BC|nr:dixin isoform X2 [Lethenteron reissneri]